MTMEKKTYRPLSTAIVLDSCLIQACIRQTINRPVMEHLEGATTMKKLQSLITFSPDTVKALEAAYAGNRTALIKAIGEAVDANPEVSVRTVADSVRVVAQIHCAQGVLNAGLSARKADKSDLDIAKAMQAEQTEINRKQKESSDTSKGKNKAKSEAKALQDAKETIFKLTASPLEKAQRAFDDAFDTELTIEATLKKASIVRMKARIELAYCEINGGAAIGEIERLKVMIADIGEVLKELEA